MQIATLAATTESTEPTRAQLGAPPPVAWSRGARARRPRAALLLFLACLLIYNANLRGIGAGDSLAARYLPLGIWRHGTLRLDPIARLAAHGHAWRESWSKPLGEGRFFEPWAYWIAPTRGHHLAAFYPIVAPVVVTPLYLPAVLYLHLRGWEPWRVDWVAAVMEKLSASLLAAIAVVLVYRLLKRDAGAWALPLAVAFAFGTNTWMISSQALWQHGMGEVLVALALLLVTSPLTPARCAALGAVCIALAANRPPDALIAAVVALYAVWSARRTAVWLLAGAAAPLALLLVYDASVVGNLAGGYWALPAWRMHSFMAHSALIGLPSLLLSPMRGLLVFSPFLGFVPIGLARRLRRPDTKVLAALLALAVVAQLVVYAKGDWRAGTSFGPRWTTDLLPILMWMLAPAVPLMRVPARVALVVAAVAAIAVQTISASWYAATSDQILFTSGDGWPRQAWRIANAPFVAELRHPRQRGDLLCAVRGYFDHVGDAPLAATDPAPAIGTGTRLQGWALACGRTPAQIVLLADGRIVGHAERFERRADVAAAMGTTAASAWSVEADTLGLAPGEHVLQLAVRAEPLGDHRIVSERRVVVTPDISALAQRAAARVREHQSAEGYWLTAFTAGTRFEHPGQEMNTFLTSMLVDLLTPVAKDHGLEDMLEKARRHLAAQIEADGLVRYHGLPDGPGIGTLGCAITPDADDTALVWRIVRPPANDPRRAPMLRILKGYRDGRGFYRTWLAPRERFQCLDPGRDADPADATIQMHVLLMLAETDNAAARSLCQPLARSIGDESLWVYYARAPLVPFLRTADLQRIGCTVEIPRARLTPVDGQERWMEAARLLVQLQEESPVPTANGQQRVQTLLADLSRDDFAALRRTPPLLYHNDLTATVSRYYWSEDFGYALWLRLYAAAGAEAARSSGSDRASETAR